MSGIFAEYFFLTGYPGHTYPPCSGWSEQGRRLPVPARQTGLKSTTRRTSHTPLLIISLILHIRKPTPTPTLNIRGTITSNPDVTMHLKNKACWRGLSGLWFIWPYWRLNVPKGV